MFKYSFFLSLILLPLMMISGCGDVPDDAFVISISPNSATLLIGMTQKFVASAQNEIGETVYYIPSWSVGDTSIGTIEYDTGNFHANATGETSVLVTIGGNTSSTPVIVTTGEIQSIEITPSLVSMDTGADGQFTAVGKNIFGGDITITPTWEVIGGIGTIDATGYFTSEVSGTGNILATFG